MNHEREMLIEAAAGVIERHAFVPPEGEAQELDFDASLWDAMAEHGFTLAAAPEDNGGFGGTLADAAAVLKVAGNRATAMPLGETLMVASWALAESGARIPEDRPLTVATDTSDLKLTRIDDAWRIDGSLSRVPWAESSVCVAVLDSDDAISRVVAIPPDALEFKPGSNLAGESRPDVVAHLELPDSAVAEAPAIIDSSALIRRGALARSIEMTGAMSRCVDLTIEFVNQRQQFGRPLSRFQAVQQQVAELVAETTAASGAVEAAILAESRGPAPNAVAIAKSRAGRAAGTVARIAHQLHGAIGITDEYELHRFTRRLWAWRDEFGSDTKWSIELGRSVVTQDAEPSLFALTRLAGK